MPSLGEPHLPPLVKGLSAGLPPSSFFHSKQSPPPTVLPETAASPPPPQNSGFAPRVVESGTGIRRKNDSVSPQSSPQRARLLRLLLIAAMVIPAACYLVAHFGLSDRQSASIPRQSVEKFQASSPFPEDMETRGMAETRRRATATYHARLVETATAMVRARELAGARDLLIDIPEGSPYFTRARELMDAMEE